MVSQLTGSHFASSPSSVWPMLKVWSDWMEGPFCQSFCQSKRLRWIDMCTESCVRPYMSPSLHIIITCKDVSTRLSSGRLHVCRFLRVPKSVGLGATPYSTVWVLAPKNIPTPTVPSFQGVIRRWICRATGSPVATRWNMMLRSTRTVVPTQWIDHRILFRHWVLEHEMNIPVMLCCGWKMFEHVATWRLRNI